MRLPCSSLWWRGKFAFETSECVADIVNSRPCCVFSIAVIVVIVLFVSTVIVFGFLGVILARACIPDSYYQSEGCGSNKCSCAWGCCRQFAFLLCRFVLLPALDDLGSVLFGIEGVAEFAIVAFSAMAFCVMNTSNGTLAVAFSAFSCYPRFSLLFWRGSWCRCNSPAGTFCRTRSSVRRVGLARCGALSSLSTVS